VEKATNSWEVNICEFNSLNAFRFINEQGMVSRPEFWSFSNTARSEQNDRLEAYPTLLSAASSEIPTPAF
jgi:hypothetical protein